MSDPSTEDNNSFERKREHIYRIFPLELCEIWELRNGIICVPSP